MFEFFKKVLNNGIQEENKPMSAAGNGKVTEPAAAVAVFMVDIARADNNFTEEERSKIASLMGTMYDLEEETIYRLINAADEYLSKEDSIYDYTNVINGSFNNEEKFELLKKLWRLVFVDGRMDMYEEHIVKKIGGLIDVDYSYIINSKIAVKKELNL